MARPKKKTNHSDVDLRKEVDDIKESVKLLLEYLKDKMDSDDMPKRDRKKPVDIEKLAAVPDYFQFKKRKLKIPHVNGPVQARKPTVVTEDYEDPEYEKIIKGMANKNKTYRPPSTSQKFKCTQCGDKDEYSQAYPAGRLENRKDTLLCRKCQNYARA